MRGETTTIVEERRPVPLYQHVMVGRRLLDLFASSDVDAAAGFVKEGAPVNGELMKIARDDWASTRLMRDRRSPRKGKPGLKVQVLQGRAQRRQRPPGLDPEPGRRRRPARPRGAAAGDRLHLQPGRLRRRGPAVPQRRRAADLAGGAGHDPRLRRGRLPGPARRGPARPRLPRLPRRADPRHRRPPRRDAAGVQARGRGALRPRPLQGGLRDRDPGAGHQHAGPHRGHREAHQVERRGARRHHPGGVHPAHRPGRPPRPRRRGARRRALAARHEPARGRRARLDPHLPAPLVVPPVVQHGGQPGRTSTAARPPASCSSSPSPSSRPTRPWSGWPGSCARRRRRSRGTPSPRGASSATSWSTPACGAGSPTSRRGRARPAAPTAARRSIESLRLLKRGDVIEVPTGKFAGLRRRDRPRAGTPSTRAPTS